MLVAHSDVAVFVPKRLKYIVDTLRISISVVIVTFYPCIFFQFDQRMHVFKQHMFLNMQYILLLSLLIRTSFRFDVSMIDFA